MSVRRLRHIGMGFPTICRARMWQSILMSASVPAAAAHSTSSARRSARCSTSCRRGCGFCASVVPNMGAVPAGRSTRLRARAPHRQGNGQPRPAGACAGEQILRPHPALSPKPDLCAGTGRLSARPWRTGSVVRAGGWNRCRHASASCVLARPKSSPTTRQFRCWIPRPVAPRPADCGFIHATIGLWSGPDPPAAVYFYSPDRKARAARLSSRSIPWRSARSTVTPLRAADRAW